MYQTKHCSVVYSIMRYSETLSQNLILLCHCHNHSYQCTFLISLCSTLSDEAAAKIQPDSALFLKKQKNKNGPFVSTTSTTSMNCFREWVAISHFFSRAFRTAKVWGKISPLHFAVISWLTLPLTCMNLWSQVQLLIIFDPQIAPLTDNK